METHYDTLKVARDAPPEVIRAAYKSLAGLHHPDRNHGSKESVRILQKINQAYEILTNVRLRDEYDAELRRKEQEQTSAKRNADATNKTSNSADGNRGTSKPIPPHVHELIKRELTAGTPPAKAIDQLVDAGYDRAEAIAAVRHHSSNQGTSRQTRAQSPDGPKPTPVSAWIALGFGIAGLILFMPLAIVALVSGHIARKHIALSPTPQKGKGIALAGLILGYISIGIFLIVMVGIGVLAILE